MESADKEKEYSRSVWEIYSNELKTANQKKRLELNKRMIRYREFRKNGLSASQAYIKSLWEELDKSPADKKIKEIAEPKIKEKGPDKLLGISLAFNKRKESFFLLIIVLAASIVYGGVMTATRNAPNAELKAVRKELGSTKQALTLTQTKLSSTQSTLDMTKTELADKEQKLTSTQSELTSTKQTLTLSQVELSSVNQTLNSVQQNLATLQATLSKTQQQLAIAQETLSGLGITLYTSKENSDVELIDNRKATNPTLNQLVEFIFQDQTDRLPYYAGKLPYATHEYDCSQLSRDVHNHSEAVGIRSAVVHVWFRGEKVGHALNAFLTTDYGLVYVDSTGTPDKIVRVKKGKEMLALEFKYGLPITMIRMDSWWDSLSSYYWIDPLSDIYWIPSSASPSGKAVTSSIEMYW
ncbi:MAG: hypothetical protein V1767_01760 [Chloroflexota bacterium]